MAERADVSLSFLLAVIFLSLCVRKFCFISPDGISITFDKVDLGNGDVSHAFTSFYVKKDINIINSRKCSSCIILLFLCGDIEYNPGPEGSFFAQRGTKIVHQNIRGLFNNISNLICFIDQNKNVDIITLSETHIRNGSHLDNNNLYHIEGYNFVNRNRTKGIGGGVGCYIKENINWKRRHDLETENIESLWIEILVTKSKSFLIATFYRPPINSKHLPNDFNKNFNDLLTKASAENKEILILGDFNVDYLKDDNNKVIKETFKLHGFTQLIKHATRITKDSETLIDLIATNKPLVISRTEVLPTAISDHDMVCCLRRLNNIKFQGKSIECRNYAHYNHDSMNNDFLNVDWTPLYMLRDVNKAVEFFNTTVKSIFDKHAPFITKRVRGKPFNWITPEVRKIMIDRDRLLKKARKTKRTNDWNLYRSLRNKCNNKIKSAKSTFQRNLLHEHAGNPSKFWNCVKKIFPYKAKTVTNENSRQSTNLATVFSEYFQNAVSLLKRKAFILKNFAWKFRLGIPVRTTAVFRIHHVNSNFVINQLKSFKRNKASGADDLPPGLLKDCRYHIAEPLVFILNLSIDTNTIPQIWKIAKVTPIYKKGSLQEPSNYRPISVLPVLSKILERAIHTQLSAYLENHKLITIYQFGYRKSRSTNIAATILVDEIREMVDKGLMVGTVFIDLSKAFDTLSHNVLLSKLSSYGIRNNELLWFTDYLFSRQQYVQVNNHTSNLTHVLTGVPQGSILGPLLFNLYFNDVVDQLCECRILMYADDTVLYYGNKDIICIETVLTNELKYLADYFIQNELIINLNKGKTETMLFGTSKKLAAQERSLAVYFGNHLITNTTSYVYLGHTLDQSLYLNNSFQSAYKKASSRVKLMMSLSSHLTTETAQKIYMATIVPILVYMGTLKLQFTATQQARLHSLERRVSTITRKRVPSIENLIKRQCCKTVKKCLENDTCYNMSHYFQLNQHVIDTRNNGMSVKLPSYKLEFGKKSFRYVGSKWYNDLPLEIRKENGHKFVNKLQNHFN